MLLLKIPPREAWDEAKEEFVSFVGATLQLEHSLISLAKWEAIWHKPFLAMVEKNEPTKPAETTEEEFKSYIQCMVMTQNFDPSVLDYLTPENKKQIKEYIEDPMTATWFRKDPKKHGQSGIGMVLTAEVIYYFMIDCGIPKDMEKWHLNRLMTLIRVVKEKEKGGNSKKPSERELLSRYASINAARRGKFKK